MNERLKLLRKTLNLSMEKFGNLIGVSNVTIWGLEKGKTLTETMIIAICDTFKVNEDWLRYGNGDMFTNKIDNYIDLLANDYNLDNLEKSILKGYAQLDSEKRKVIKQYIQNVVDNFLQGEDDDGNK